MEELSDSILNNLRDEAIDIVETELMELIVAIRRYKEYKDNKDVVVDSLASVIIVLDWIKKYAEITLDELDNVYLAKFNKLKEQMEENELC